MTATENPPGHIPAPDWRKHQRIVPSGRGDPKLLQEFRDTFDRGQRTFVELSLLAARIRTERAWEAVAMSECEWVMDHTPYTWSDFHRLAQFGTLLAAAGAPVDILSQLPFDRIKSILPIVRISAEGNLINGVQVLTLAEQARDLSSDDFLTVIAQRRAKGEKLRVLVSEGTPVYVQVNGQWSAEGKVRNVKVTPGWHKIEIHINTRALRQENIIRFYSELKHGEIPPE